MKRYLQAFLLIFFLFPPSITVNAQQITLGTDTSNPIVEQYIIESVKKGEIADLEVYFSDESNRIISADFFESLLLEKIIPISAKGISINGAKIVGPIDLTDAILKNINVTNCTFSDTVNIQRSKFEYLNLSACTFQSILNINETTIYNTININDSIFYDAVHFNSLNIGTNLSLSRTFFTSQERVSLVNINVVGGVFANDAVFEGPVDFTYLKINNALTFDNSQFKSHENIQFHEVLVEKSAFFRNINFSGPLDFGYIKIGGSLDFSRSIFESPDRVRFYGMNIANYVVFQNAFFSSPVFFLRSNIDGALDFSHAQFTSTSIVSFDTLYVKNEIIFENTVFNGAITFNKVHSSGIISFDKSMFLYPDGMTILNNIETGGIRFNETVFEGGLIIEHSNINGNISSRDASLQSENKPFQINNVHAHAVIFDSISPIYSFTFTSSTATNFRLTAKQRETRISVLGLSNTKIQQTLEIENFTIKTFDGSNLMSHGKAQLSNIKIQDNLNLSYSEFDVLVLQNFSWPTSVDQVNLDGLTYKQITPGETLNHSNWKQLLDLINGAKYNILLYKNLEIALNEFGYPDYADAVSVEQKRRERLDTQKWYSIKWWWNLFLDTFILYGKQPGRAFLWSMLVVFWGTIIFKKQKMGEIGGTDRKSRNIKKEKNNDRDGYSSFWYSVDLFIPAINLGMSDKWSPKSTEKNAIIYRRIHIILGWIMIPIALLSITGIIR